MERVSTCCHAPVLTGDDNIIVCENCLLHCDTVTVEYHGEEAAFLTAD